MEIAWWDRPRQVPDSTIRLEGHGQESECDLERLGRHRRVLRRDVVYTNHPGDLVQSNF